MPPYTDLTTPRVAPGSREAAAAQQAADLALLRGTPTAPVAAPVQSGSVPSPIVVPNRDPSLLESARIEAEKAAASRADARRQADSYAAQMRQARIDAINQAYAPRIQREKEEGDARLSRVAALNLRTGTVGSGFDTTRTGEQKSLNEKALQALEAEKAQAINEAFGWADELSRQRASEIYEDTKEAANAKVTRYKEQAETALSALNIFGAQNVTADQLKTVDPKTYETLRDVSGMSDAQIDAYLKAHAPEGTYQWNAAQISGSTMYVPKIENGKIVMDKVDLGYTPGKEYKTTVKTDEGVLVIYSDGTYDVLGGSTGNGTITGFKNAEVETDIRADAVALMDSVDAGEITIDKAYDRLRKLYSPQEVSDDALRNLLDIPAPKSVPDEAVATVAPSEIENEIAELQASGILTKSDIRYALKKRGYTAAEINSSSIANPIDVGLAALENFLFSK